MCSAGDGVRCIRDCVQSFCPNATEGGRGPIRQNLSPKIRSGAARVHLATSRLTHARNLTFPTGGATPRNRRLLGGIGATTTDDDASSQQKKREDGFLERGHCFHRINTAKSPFCKTPRNVSGKT